MSKKLNQYEAMFLLPAGVIEVEAAIKLSRGVVEKHGGNVLVAKKWDERKLAYEIGKAKRGIYVLVYFQAPGAAIALIDRDVRLSEQFTRVLITDADHLAVEEMEAVEPQPIQIREERPAFDGGYGSYNSGLPPAPRGFRRREEAETGKD
jgi:small subunit ribosomal protein S6